MYMPQARICEGGNQRKVVQKGVMLYYAYPRIKL